MQHIIFISGFYGTRLVQASNKRVIWISAWQATLGKQTAARTGFGIPGELALIPTTVLTEVPIIPHIYGIDVYRAFLKELRSQLIGHTPHAQLHLFAYDWRNDYLLAVKQLAKFVAKLRHDGATSISIIAHSMGGLITSYYLRYGDQEPHNAIENWTGAQHIDRVVLATVPFKGSMTALRNMKHGAKFGLNSTLIKAPAFATFASVYEMMPTYEPILLDGDLTPLPYSLYEH